MSLRGFQSAPVESLRGARPGDGNGSLSQSGRVEFPSSDAGQTLIGPKDASLAKALTKLDGFADGADFILVHNLIDFDLPHLKAANPGLRLLQLSAVDTLRLNPLAFSRNPYRSPRLTAMELCHRASLANSLRRIARRERPQQHPPG